MGLGMESCCFMGTDEKGPGDGLHNNVKVLNVNTHTLKMINFIILKMLKMINFVLCVFYHNEKLKKLR